MVPDLKVLHSNKQLECEHGAHTVALLFSSRLPLPTGSGSPMRAWNWLVDLSATYAVVVVVPEDQLECALPHDYPALQVVGVPVPGNILNRVQQLAGLLCPPLCLLYRRYAKGWYVPSRAIKKQLRALVSGYDIRKICVFRLFMHEYAQGLVLAKGIYTSQLDMDDLESLTKQSNARCAARLGYYVKAASYYLTAWQCKLLEKRVAATYNQVYLASPDDVQALHPENNTYQVQVRPNRVRVPLPAPEPADRAVLRILFTGTLAYLPNEEALRLLVGQILPALQAQITNKCVLRVVGRRPAARLEKLLGNNPAIEWITNAASLDEHYALANMVLVPLQAGGGTKIKTLEAMAHARPVIATAEGVRGLDVVAGRHYLAAQTAAEMAQAAADLWHQPRWAESIANAGRRLCQEKYSL